MKLVKLSEYFEIKYGVNLEFQNMKQDINGIPFVSRTEKNNGVAGIVQKIDNIAPNPSNTISVACGGSVMESFLQKNEYYSGRDLFYLKPKMDFTDSEMLFYCACLRANKYRYSYGRQANKTLSEIQIPHKNSIPDFVYKKDIKSISKEPLHNDKLQLNKEKWQKFSICDLFVLDKAKCSSASELLTNGNEIFYIGAKKNDNGIMAGVKTVDNLISKGNSIVFIGDGQGSIGYATYQPIDFIGSTTLTVGYSKHLNKYNAMFLVTVLDSERYRYSFGRKYGKTIVHNAQIKLPATQKGEPDWEFMENYIKSLPYSSSL